MSTNFVKFTVSITTSINQEIYINPKLIRTVQSKTDKSTIISLGGQNSYVVGLPIEEVFKLIDK